MWDVSANLWELLGASGNLLTSFRELQIGPHRPHDRPTLPSRWSSIAPRLTHIAPRWVNIAPRLDNIAPRCANIGSRWTYITFKIGQHSPKMGIRRTGKQEKKVSQCCFKHKTGPQEEKKVSQCCFKPKKGPHEEKKVSQSV